MNWYKRAFIKIASIEDDFKGADIDVYFEKMKEEENRRRKYVLSFLDSQTGGQIPTKDGFLIISKNTYPDKDKYPWRVTTFYKDGKSIGHTTHSFLDLENDSGPYYKSAVGEVLYNYGIEYPPEYKTASTKLSNVRGEFWIIEGNAIYCDSDIGDIGHEGYVLDTIRNEIMDDPEESFTTWEQRVAQEILEEKIENIIDPQLKQNLINEYKDNIVPFILEYIENEGVVDAKEKLLLLFGRGDPREYAMKKWGWKRLMNDNVETWTLTPKDIKNISNGLYDAYDEEAKVSEFNIFVYATKEFFENIPFEIIDKKEINMFELNEYARR